MIYLLDTDHASALQGNTTETKNLLARLRLLAPDDYGITIVSFKEQVEGRLNQVNRAKSPPEYTTAFALLNDTLRFYTSLAVWQYTDAAAQRFDMLKKSKLLVGTQDLQIAAIALSENATLLTRNIRDFGKVPGLLFEDWTMP